MFPEDHHYFDITMLLLLVLVLTIAIVLSKIQNRKLQKMNKNLSDLRQELEEKNKMLEEVATSDKLTGIKNRNYFDQRLYDEMATMDRYGGDLTLIFFDLDHFKNVNDRYGHDIGDEVLVAIAKHVDGLMRKNAIYRIGTYGP
jgi:PleD family two-component response regulator